MEVIYFSISSSDTAASDSDTAYPLYFPSVSSPFEASGSFSFPHDDIETMVPSSFHRTELRICQKKRDKQDIQMELHLPRGHNRILYIHTLP